MNSPTLEEIGPFLEVIREADIEDGDMTPLIEEAIVKISQLLGRQESGRFRPAAPKNDYTEQYEKSPKGLVRGAMSENSSLSGRLTDTTLDIQGLGPLGNLIRVDFARLLGLKILDGCTLAPSTQDYPEIVGSLLEIKPSFVALLPYRLKDEVLVSSSDSSSFTPDDQFLLQQHLHDQYHFHLMNDHKASIAVLKPTGSSDEVPPRILNDVLNRVVSILMNQSGRSIITGKKTDYEFDNYSANFRPFPVRLHPLNKKVAIV